jgi:predicted membrane protein DUF2127
MSHGWGQAKDNSDGRERTGLSPGSAGSSLATDCLTEPGHGSRHRGDPLGVLQAFEGVGLLLHRRWAEYLGLLAICAFLRRDRGTNPSSDGVGALALMVNIAIIFYLGWRKRLFPDRPPAPARGDVGPHANGRTSEHASIAVTIAALGC